MYGCSKKVQKQERLRGDFYGNPFRTKLAKNHGQMRIEKNATLSNSFSNDNGKMQHSQIHSQMTMEK